MEQKDNIIVANNLVAYRKALGLTQLELAEKLNYSDKSVSKWERGESLPDIFVMKQLADFYGVKIDDFFSVKHKVRKENLSFFARVVKYKYLLITLMSAVLVWLVATIAFVFLSYFEVGRAYLAFIVAIPVTFIVLVVFTALWSSPLAYSLSTSGLIWTLFLAIHQIFADFNVIYIYLIGIPLQVLCILWCAFCYLRKKSTKSEQSANLIQ